MGGAGFSFLIFKFLVNVMFIGFLCLFFVFLSFPLLLFCNLAKINQITKSMFVHACLVI